MFLGLLVALFLPSTPPSALASPFTSIEHFFDLLAEDATGETGPTLTVKNEEFHSLHDVIFSVKGKI